MNNRIFIEDLRMAMEKRIFPSITFWNRLESRPRSRNFERALKAEIRDPLWMLAKQWQMGEFEGDDAGSPVFAQAQIARSELIKYQADSHPAQIFNKDIPLEAIVEQKEIPFLQDNKITAVNLRLLMGRHWLKMIRPTGLAAKFTEVFGFSLPDPQREEDAVLAAHTEVRQHLEAIAGKAMDGFALYEYLKKDPGNTASRAVSEPENDDLNQSGEKFIAWFERLFLQPAVKQEDAWNPERMEYQFRTALHEKNTEKVLTADQYFHGRLDWYNLDIDSETGSLPLSPEIPAEQPQRTTQTFIPTPLRLPGMPATRWWQFEDGNVNLNYINPDTTDINKLLFIEFSLIDGTDWFHIPFTTEAGSLVSVTGLSVTNVFGEKTWIEASGKGMDADWQRWNMFGLSTAGSTSARTDNSILILPVVEKIQEGKPLEEVVFIRDEVANMVWGIEKKIPTATGQPKHGKEAADELEAFYQRVLDKSIESGTTPPDNPDYKAPVRYEIMNKIPENWIPFIPVHLPGSSREIHLQRASMPRILKRDKPENIKKIKPRTQLLREGLDTVPVKTFFIPEEEIPRAGISVSQTFQRARWYNGKVITWFGAQKQTGRGEGSSGLRFDGIRPVEK